MIEGEIAVGDRYLWDRDDLEIPITVSGWWSIEGGTRIIEVVAPGLGVDMVEESSLRRYARRVEP